MSVAEQRLARERAARERSLGRHQELYDRGQLIDENIRLAHRRAPLIRKRQGGPIPHPDNFSDDLALRVFHGFPREALSRTYATEADLDMLTRGKRDYRVARALLPSCGWVPKGNLLYAVIEGNKALSALRSQHPDLNDMEMGKRAVAVALQAVKDGKPKQSRKKSVPVAAAQQIAEQGAATAASAAAEQGPDGQNHHGQDPARQSQDPTHASDDSINDLLAKAGDDGSADQGRGGEDDGGDSDCHDLGAGGGDGAGDGRDGGGGSHNDDDDDDGDLDNAAADDHGAIAGDRVVLEKPAFHDEFAVHGAGVRPSQPDGSPYPEETDSEKSGVLLMGAMMMVTTGVEQLQAHRAEGQLMDTVFHRDLSWFANNTIKVLSEFHETLEEGAADQARHDQELREEEVIRDRLREAGVTLGSDSHSAQLCAIGHTVEEPHRLVSLCQSSPQITVNIGSPGQGKSTFTTVLAEGNSLRRAGHSRVRVPGATVSFSADWQTGSYAPEMLAGFRPNGNQSHTDRLWDTYLARPDAFRRGTLWVMKGQQEQAQDELHELVAAGRLRIRPIGVHNTEWSKLGVYAIMRGNDPKEPQYLQFVWDCFRRHGSGVQLRDIYHDIRSTNKLRKDNKERALWRVRKLEQLWTPNCRLQDGLVPESMNFVDIRSPDIDSSDVMPITLLMLNAIARSGIDGYQLLILLDELNKYDGLDLVGKYLLALLRERRHKHMSLVLSAQTVDELIEELLPLASNVAVFKLLSPKEYAKIQRVRGPYRDVPYDRIVSQVQGQAMVHAAQATDAGFVQTPGGIWIRPPCTEPGGTTVSLD